jgi:hypothetical protein
MIMNEQTSGHVLKVDKQSQRNIKDEKCGERETTKEER